MAGDSAVVLGLSTYTPYIKEWKNTPTGVSIWLVTQL